MGETGTTACAKIGPVSYLQVTCAAQLHSCAMAVISQSHAVQDISGAFQQPCTDKLAGLCKQRHHEGVAQNAGTQRLSAVCMTGLTNMPSLVLADWLLRQSPFWLCEAEGIPFIHKVHGRA